MPPTESSGPGGDEASLSDSLEETVKEYFLSDDPTFCRLAKLDNSRWKRGIKLDVDSQIRHLYDTKSYVGHAESGHCAWEDHSYSHATVEEIVRALEYNPDEVRAESEAWMGGCQDLIISGLDNPEKALSLVDSEGYVVGGIKEFKGMKIEDPLLFAWGFYLAGAVMDNAEWRHKMADWFKEEFGYELPIHTGECVPIDLKQLAHWDAQYGDDMELNITTLASLEWDETDIEWFKEVGIIPKPEEGEDWVQAGRTTVSAYIQLTRGMFGGSDDASINYIGRVYGQDAMIGAYLADWFDTFDKYPDKIYHGGRDERVANMILEHPTFQEEFGPEGRDWLRDDVNFAFLLFGSSVPVEYLKAEGNMTRREVRKVKFPSSSQSRFLRLQKVQGGKNMTALKGHLDYAMYGENPPRGLVIAFEQMEGENFYKKLDNKFLFFDDNEMFVEGHEPLFI